MNPNPQTPDELAAVDKAVRDAAGVVKARAVRF